MCVSACSFVRALPCVCAKVSEGYFVRMCVSVWGACERGVCVFFFNLLL